MFSSSTIESSTSRPTPSASPPSVNTFSVCPVKYSSTNVAMIDSGMATAMMPVARRLTRKIRITSTASSPPHAASCSSALTAERMYLRLIERDRQAARWAARRAACGSAARIASTTAMVFAPGCLSTRR